MNQVQNNGTVQSEEDPEVVKERLECFADMDWALSDPEVQVKYWDQLVAVYQRKVVAHGINTAKLLDEAQKVTGAPRNRIMVVGIGGWE